MVKNITPYCLTSVNDTLFFAAEEELWKSDGTDAGTRMVKDIVPGYLGSIPFANEWCELTKVGDLLFFVAGYYGNESHGGEVWKSDGTEEGTVLVKDINPGVDDACSPFVGCNLTDVDGILFFVAYHEDLGRELWKSDGTKDGTVLVKDINPGSDYGICSENYYYGCDDLTSANGLLYINSNDGLHGYELWRSDGTVQNTVMVQDIAPGLYSSGPYYLTNTGSYLYFSADDIIHGNELWALPLDDFPGTGVYLPLVVSE